MRVYLERLLCFEGFLWSREVSFEELLNSLISISVWLKGSLLVSCHFLGCWGFLTGGAVVVRVRGFFPRFLSLQELTMTSMVSFSGV